MYLASNQNKEWCSVVMLRPVTLSCKRFFFGKSTSTLIHHNMIYFPYSKHDWQQTTGGNDMNQQQGLSGSNQMNAGWVLCNRTWQMLKMSPWSSAFNMPNVLRLLILPRMRWEFSWKMKIQRDLLTKQLYTNRSALQSYFAPRHAQKHTSLSHQSLHPNQEYLRYGSQLSILEFTERLFTYVPICDIFEKHAMLSTNWTMWFY
jgi:hypothetical protein